MTCHLLYDLLFIGFAGPFLCIGFCFLWWSCLFYLLGLELFFYVAYIILYIAVI